MQIIIDGYNLMYCMKLKGESLQEKRQSLIDELHQFLEVNNADIVIVFDGHRNLSMHKSIEKHGKIKIIYSANNQTADDVIIEMIKNRKIKARNIVVVTSDRKIINYAVLNRIKIVKSMDFAEYFE